jgi:frataxin-like iron-binding protein CyaY
MHSGPKRFNFDTATRQWVDGRSGELLEALLNKELKTSLGAECRIDIDLKSKDSQ